MHFNQSDAVALAQADLEDHLAQQSEAVASESLQKVRFGLRGVVKEAAQDFLDMSQFLLEQAFHMGQSLLRMKTDLKPGEYQVFLAQIGWTTAKASIYIKLAKTFEGFAIAHLRRIDLATLFTLCRNTYSGVVEQMQDMGEVTQKQVNELMKLVRPARKPQQTEPESGWISMPSGGGRCYGLLLHDDKTGVLIEKHAEIQKAPKQRIVEEAMVMYDQYKSTAASESDWVEIVSSKLKQVETWEEVAQAVDCNTSRFTKAIKDWSLEERQQRLIPLLAKFLLQNRIKINDLFWVPQRLLMKALFAAGLLHPKYFVA